MKHNNCCIGSEAVRHDFLSQLRIVKMVEFPSAVSWIGFTLAEMTVRYPPVPCSTRCKLPSPLLSNSANRGSSMTMIAPSMSGWEVKSCPTPPQPPPDDLKLFPPPPLPRYAPTLYSTSAGAIRSLGFTRCTCSTKLELSPLV